MKRIVAMRIIDRACCVFESGDESWFPSDTASGAAFSDCPGRRVKEIVNLQSNPLRSL